MKKDTTNDMTVGSPVSLIIKFMIPMCLGNLFQQFYNIAIIVAQMFGAKKFDRDAPLCCHVHLPYGCIFHCHDNRFQSCEQTNSASDEFTGRGI